MRKTPTYYSSITEIVAVIETEKMAIIIIYAQNPSFPFLRSLELQKLQLAPLITVGW